MVFWGIAIAGALGALARWGLGTLWSGPRFAGYPIGTLCANLVACFLLGIVMEMEWMSHDLRSIITIGFIGTLSTFSTWEFETFTVARRGDMLLAAGVFSINIFLGFVLLWTGARLGAALR